MISQHRMLGQERRYRGARAARGLRMLDIDCDKR